MAARVLWTNMVPIGFSPEVTYGTAVNTGRRAIPGHVTKARFKVDENVKDYIEIGQNANTVSFYRGRRMIDWEVTYEMTDDYDGTNADSSLWSYALGSSPSAGVPTLVPSSSTANLRSFTMEAGYDWSGTDVYYLLTGCMIRSAEASLKDGEPVVGNIKGVAQQVADNATIQGTAPSLRTARPLFADSDLTLTITDPAEAAVTTLDITDMTLKLDNALAIKGAFQGTPARTIGEPQIVKRRVTLDFDLWRTGRQIEDFLADNDPAGASTDWDIDLELDNGNNNFFNAVLTNARVTSPWGLEVSAGAEKPIEDKVTFMASTTAWDFIGP